MAQHREHRRGWIQNQPPHWSQATCACASPYAPEPPTSPGIVFSLPPGKALAYSLLQEAAPELSEHLRGQAHTTSGSNRAARLIPMGYGPPVFPKAPSQPRRYAAGGEGHLELGSPHPRIFAAWRAAIQDRDAIDWGGTHLDLLGHEEIPPPEFSDGVAVMRTQTPVLIKKYPSDWVLPGEAGWVEGLINNLERKAEHLGLPGGVELDRITWEGAKRGFDLGRGRGIAPGKAAEVILKAEPETLQGIWDWGLGQTNSGGFGWIRGDTGQGRGHSTSQASRFSHRP